MKCPGRDTRFIKADIRKCRSCGYDVEIFSDEIRAVCRKCGDSVCRETPSCVDWCRYAKDCLGEALWKEMKETKRILG